MTFDGDRPNASWPTPAGAESPELYEFVGRVGNRFGVTSFADADDLCAPECEAVVLRTSGVVSVEMLRERLSSARVALTRARVGLVAAPVAALVASSSDPPLAALRPLGAALEHSGLNVEFLGVVPSPPSRARWAVAVFNGGAPPPTDAPGDFRVAAIMTAYNEQDIVRPTIERLLADGIRVHVIDNWSTDATTARIDDLVQRGAISIERFPSDGPSSSYEWARLLSRVSEVAASLDADWCIHHDVDQRRDSPWRGMRLRDAIYRVDRWGFNAIDHTLLEFRPVDNGFRDGTEPSEYFRRFEWVPSAGAPHVQSWKNQQPVDLASSGGHDVSFSKRRVFPYNFLLRHYPIRSQQHGEQKVFRERQSRYTTQEIDRGWHYHYERLRRGHRFVRKPADLVEFVDGQFDELYLLPRLARVRIPIAKPRGWARIRRQLIAFMRRAGVLGGYVAAHRRLRRARARRSSN
jgi:glycosyltransferase involved in cell wall biosynthesis